METKTPKISVVMPTYNAEEHLSKAIDSILAQTFDDFEFLIVNDNSKDKTREIIKSYNDERIRLIDGQCKGLAAALNQGIQEAKGEYIARMDADDISLPTRFAKQVTYMDEHKDITVLGTCQQHCYEDGKDGYRHTPFAKNEELMIAMIFEPSVCHSTVMLRKCDIIENKFFYLEGSPCEDGELWMRIIKTHKFATIQQVLGKYLLSETSITEKKKDLLSKYEVTLRQKYLKDMFGYILKDEDKYLLNMWKFPFENMSSKQIYLSILRLKKVLKEIELAINKKHILPALRVNRVLDFFYLKISGGYRVKKIHYKLLGVIPLIKSVQIGNLMNVYLLSCIRILKIIK
ncbi:MAG: glycosyltransferase family 2 protein [Endomicrobium sp.]|jgi:glycosyltransferase involved in cell wall biosynthesis|nr:glycosyltransferase family 2 protein [Endomicrobium sp.]